MNRRIVINGRFLTRRATGVERYGAGILSAIDGFLAENSALVDGLDIVVAVPASVRERRYLNIEHKVLPLEGYLWEQVSLPAWARGAEIWNFCNLAPLAAPGIVCIHDAHIHVLPENYRIAYRSAQRVMQPIIASRARRIVTVSEHSKRRLAQFGIAQPDRVVVIPCSADHARAFDPSRSRLNISHLPENYVLLLGSSSANKNAGCILQIASDLDKLGIRIVLTGGGGHGVLATTGEISNENVVRLGYVNDDDLALLYSRALCLAFPSIEEGFGIPPLEAFIWGAPVVASNTSSIPEVCGDGALYADPRDPAAWLAQIKLLRDDARLREMLVFRGRERAKLFSFDASAKRWLDFAREDTL